MPKRRRVAHARWWSEPTGTRYPYGVPFRIEIDRDHIFICRPYSCRDWLRRPKGLPNGPRSSARVNNILPGGVIASGAAKDLLNRVFAHAKLESFASFPTDVNMMSSGVPRRYQDGNRRSRNGKQTDKDDVAPFHVNTSVAIAKTLPRLRSQTKPLVGRVELSNGYLFLACGLGIEETFISPPVSL